jgi:hypothetical protein
MVFLWNAAGKVVEMRRDVDRWLLGRKHSVVLVQRR